MAGSWIFYTTFPKIPLINPEFKNIAQFAPPLGFFIGTIQSYIFLLLRTNSWSIYASTLICLASGYLITGGLHIDGLMDTFAKVSIKPSMCRPPVIKYPEAKQINVDA